jgi:hypothetical protein
MRLVFGVHREAFALCIFGQRIRIFDPAMQRSVGTLELRKAFLFGAVSPQDHSIV